MTPIEIAAELEKPLDPKHVKPARQFGPKGDYIEGWHAIAEANRIFGWDGWHREVMDCRCVQERERKVGREQKDGWGVSYIMRVRVQAGGIVRDGTGSGHGIDVDLGLAHESAIKEAETDAMKRALMTFGNPFGLALYDKEKANVGAPEPEKPKSPPKAQPLSQQASASVSALSGFIEEMDATQTLDGLAAVWSKHRGLQKMPAAIKAKDRNKARMSGGDANPFGEPDIAERMVAAGSFGG